MPNHCGETPMATPALTHPLIGRFMLEGSRSAFHETAPEFQDLMSTVCEVNQMLHGAADLAASALSTLRETHRGDFRDSVQEIAIDELLSLRETVDNLTRQFLYATWSRRLKTHLDESMQGIKWTFPQL